MRETLLVRFHGTLNPWVIAVLRSVLRMLQGISKRAMQLGSPITEESMESLLPVVKAAGAL